MTSNCIKNLEFLPNCKWFVKPKNHRGSWKRFEFRNTIKISTICYVEENLYYEG